MSICRPPTNASKPTRIVSFLIGSEHPRHLLRPEVASTSLGAIFLDLQATQPPHSTEKANTHLSPRDNDPVKKQDCLVSQGEMNEFFTHALHPNKGDK